MQSLEFVKLFPSLADAGVPLADPEACGSPDTSGLIGQCAIDRQHGKGPGCRSVADRLNAARKDDLGRVCRVKGPLILSSRFTTTSSSVITERAMPSMTPIKVRGKKHSGSTHNYVHSSPNGLPGGKRSLSPASHSHLPAKLSRCATSNSTSTPVIARCTSSLEQLPVELLEDIFLACLNVSLPQASLLIGHKLASFRVKNQLVTRVLGSASTTEYPCALAVIYPTLREHAEAQSAILRLKWMTLPFLRDVIPGFLVKTLVRELAARRLHWMGHVPISQSIDCLIRDYITDNEYRRNDIPTHGLPAYWELNWQKSGPLAVRPRDSSPEPHQLPLRKPRKKYPDMDKVHVGIGLRDGLVTLWEPSFDEIPHYTHNEKLRHHIRFRILCCLDGCRIPEKLLHGPWTNEKCEFLEILIRGNATVDWIGTTSGEVAKEGLRQAIRERNAWATRLLLARPPRQAENHQTVYYASEKARVQNKYSISSFREDPVRRGVGIVPEYEYLRIAVLEEGCDKGVVTALLDAPPRIIGLVRTEVFQWALMGSIRGVEPANWLYQKLRLIGNY